MKQIVLTLVVFCSGLISYAQSVQLSSNAKASVLTCGPGEELYTAFGHSAIRISDPEKKIDVVYNYGTFDFNAPNFYLNFAKGNMEYLLSKSSFNRFLGIYYYEKRWVKEQTLALDNQQVQHLFSFLENNALPANRTYRYDFFYDNCATKIEAIIKKVLGDQVTFTYNHISTSYSHRELIKLYTQHQAWGQFGIDLALGSVIDDQATPQEYSFLPDYIFDLFSHATLNTDSGKTPIVATTTTLLKGQSVASPFALFNPFIILLIISILIVYRTYQNYQKNTLSRWLDMSIAFLTGNIGIVLLLLWFATSHTATYQNANVLWAFAPNLLLLLPYFKKPSRKVWYYALLLFLLLVLAFCWMLGIQEFNTAMISVVIALGIRYSFLWWHAKQQLDTSKK